MNNTLDRLQRAAIRLSQDGSIKDRLADAYALHLVDVEAEVLPQEIRDDFAELCEAMRRERPLPRESEIRASVRKMSNDEARRYAALVVQVFASLARAEVSGVAMRRNVRMTSVVPIVQLVAAEG